MGVSTFMPTWAGMLMVDGFDFGIMLRAWAFRTATEDEVVVMGGAPEYLDAQDWAQDECNDGDGRCENTESHACVNTMMAIRGQGEWVKMTILAHSGSRER